MNAESSKHFSRFQFILILYNYSLKETPELNFQALFLLRRKHSSAVKVGARHN